MSLTRIVSIFIVSCGLLLSGCATQKPVIVMAPTTGTPITSASGINQWQVQGALGANDGKQAFSANVVWNQNASRFNMTLYGPVGVGTLKIAGIPGQVTLMDSAGKKMNASSPEELLKKQTGWAIPVSYLVYWIKGLPAPNLASQSSKDSAMRIAHLQQDGWQIDYLGWSSHAGIDLPNKIAITHGALKIRMVINQWQIK